MERKKLKIVGVIPARLQSTRLPEKPLAKILDKEMILWVAENASKAKNLSKVIVATDSEKIEAVVKKAGFVCKMTSPLCRSGSDRICEVASSVDADIYVNIEGDEPLIEPELIDSVTDPFFVNPEILVTTAVSGAASEAEYKNPNCVKAVIDKNNFAMYFSRAEIPYFRNGRVELSKVHKHIGIYAYTKRALIDFANLDKSLCEDAESLEQLRFLENGYKIYCVKTNYAPKGVDTPEDLNAIIDIVKKRY